MSIHTDVENLRPDVFQAIGRVSASCGGHSALVTHHITLHLLKNELPSVFVLVSNRLHKRFDKVFGRLDT